MPEALVEDTINWYHHVLGHAGITCTLETIQTIFTASKLRERTKNFIGTCNSCQRNKNLSCPYGHLPPREDTAVPFEEVAVDLIRPWKVEITNGITVQIQAITAIDTATTLSEIQCIYSKESPHITHIFSDL